MRDNNTKPVGAAQGAADDKVKRAFKRMQKKKVCVFCTEKIKEIDYKDLPRLKKFVTDKGKIIPCRMSGNCAAHQRELTEAVKRARMIALLPFKGE